MLKKLFFLFVCLLSISLVYAQAYKLDSFNIDSSPAELALSFDDRFIFILTAPGKLIEIDTKTGYIVSTTYDQQELPPGLSQDTTYKGYEFTPNPLDNSVSITCQKSAETLKKIAVGNSPVSLVISKNNRMYVANRDDNVVSVIDLTKVITPDLKPCRRRYFGYFVAALIATLILFALSLIFLLTQAAIIKEEKKIAKYIIDHLEKGHKIEDIHEHLHKYMHPRKVHRATKRALTHITRKRAGKKSNLV